MNNYNVLTTIMSRTDWKSIEKAAINSYLVDQPMRLRDLTRRTKASLRRAAQEARIEAGYGECEYP